MIRARSSCSERKIATDTADLSNTSERYQNKMVMLSIRLHTLAFIIRQSMEWC